VENILISSDPIVNTSPLDSGDWEYAVAPVTVDDSQCTVPCSGNSQYLCGANNLLSYYVWNGTEPLYTWNFPQDSSAGEYSLLIGGVTVPLITGQVITGKITFIEKTQTGFPNGTGVYELDLSLAQQPDSYLVAWRQMYVYFHRSLLGWQGLRVMPSYPKLSWRINANFKNYRNEMITDVFCAAGLILPDKGGRQLTIGGWNGDSNFGVRLYLPDGSDGVNGTNQWQENPSNLTLQLPRWYPSAMIMANGSILVVCILLIQLCSFCVQRNCHSLYASNANCQLYRLEARSLRIMSSNQLLNYFQQRGYLMHRRTADIPTRPSTLTSSPEQLLITCIHLSVCFHLAVSSLDITMRHEFLTKSLSQPPKYYLTSL
jgi:hypothetical protein